jgi:osmotically-inducible protein OsmY
MRTSWKYGWLLVILLAGCNRQDTEALQRISHKVRARVEPWSGEVKNNAAAQWNGTLQDIGLDARVTARLRWDKNLSDLSIDVKAIGNIVEVKGTVRNLEQRRRVVMLAESTSGVEGVRDLLVESDR